MIQVLFVCLGNICRSPLAEAVFAARAKDHHLENEFICDSAGTHDYHKGSLPDPRSIKVAKENGITLTHRARKVVEQDYHQFDYFFVMDESVMNFLMAQQPSNSKAKLIYMRNFDLTANGSNEVPDPYYGNYQGFIDVFEMVNNASNVLLEKFKRGEGWNQY